jgi:type II secretory ATPase GspE/PulE/Tfp pilus assembly ATPase PilB-like protein
MIFYQLDFTAATSDALGNVLAQLKGLLLVAGPTGSGKSTSVNAMMQLAADAGRTALEIDAISASRPSPGGLVISMGDVRSADQARDACDLARNALVIAVLRSGRSQGAATRLEELGIARQTLFEVEPVILSQKLCRRLCQSCRRPATLQSQGQMRLRLTAAESDLLEGYSYAARGCSNCVDGYLGVVVISEVLHARKGDGVSTFVWDEMGSMRASALVRVAAGLTSLAEVDRLLD